MKSGDPLCEAVIAVGAVGRRLFFGRDDSAWIPWDPDATDENLKCKVLERPWPYCWGDDVWAVGLWHGQPTFLRWELGFFGEAFVGQPTTLAMPELAIALAGWLQAHATTGTPFRAAVPVKSAQVLSRAFWQRLPPKSRVAPP